MMILENKTLLTSFNAKGCDNRYGAIKVPNQVQKCTSELFIYYECDGVEKAGCADRNLFISSHCATVDCQATVRHLVDNEYVNIRAIDHVILVDFKSFRWKKFVKFLNEFVNDANDYVYIGLLLVLISILIVFVQIMTKKLSARHSPAHRPLAIPCAPPMPSPPLKPIIYEQTYDVHNEIVRINNITKELAPYTGNICKACQFQAKSNAGLNTHIKAMLNRKCVSKTIHSKYYK